MSDTADRDDEGQRSTAPSATEGKTRRRRIPRLRTAFKRIGIFLTITAVVLVFVEGCGSALIVLYDAARGPDEPVYTGYDPLLGWVNVPSTSIPDMWGRGSGLTITAQGFRGRTPVTPSVEPGRIRILCSGDSFAFGEGVGDLDTWCHLLSVSDERIETVNLGQQGYGIDQSYLRFQRDASELEHAIHLFTFVDGDFNRAGRRSYRGYAKPILRLVEDELEVGNVPVPRVMPSVTRFAIRLSERLRSVEAAGRIVNRLLPSRPSQGVAERDGLAPMFEQLFAEVQRLNQDKGSTAVFVYLPTVLDLDEEMPWRGWARAALDSLGYPFIDLTRALRDLPPEVSGGFFLPSGAPAAGHYSPTGNAWVGEALYTRLRGILPETLGETGEAVEGLAN